MRIDERFKRPAEVDLLVGDHAVASARSGPRTIRAPDRQYDLNEGDAVVLRGARLRLLGARTENGTSVRIVEIDEHSAG